ncbi:MAG: hypothetical protein CV089_04175 [Nitrospira sp. WS110]|nr:hypothetical protein [Nitrospira sp. WS110]
MSVWERLEDLSDSELRSLTTLTVEVLLDSQDDRTTFPSDLISMSTRTAARQVLPSLQEIDPSLEMATIQKALEDDQISREVAVRILAEIGKLPTLANAISERYEAQQRKLAAPELLLLAGALLTLAVKLKEVKFVDEPGPDGAKKQVVVKFSEATQVLKGVIVDLIRMARGS